MFQKVVYVYTPFGPGFWICWFCHTAKTSKFTCQCVPNHIKYCWSCKSFDCGHQAFLVADWRRRAQ